MWRNCQGTDTGRNTALPLQKCRPDTNRRGERSEVEFDCFKSLDESSCSSELLQLIPELLIFLTFNWRISLPVTNFFRFVDLPICSDKRGGNYRGPYILKENSSSPCLGIYPSSHGKTTAQKPWERQSSVKFC